ncbi:MAG: HAMP domain-containing sensor histidine kinase [Dehalococcoidia bacterium]
MALLDLLPIPACLATEGGDYVARGRYWPIPAHMPLVNGTKWQWLVDLPDRRDIAIKWTRAVASDQDFDDRCRLNGPRPGSGRWYAVHGTRMDGVLPATWLITATDIHAIKTNETRMTEFIAFLAHELSGPLTTISGNVHILNSRLATVPPDLREIALDDVEAETKRLLRLTTSLLKIARMESMEARDSCVDLDTLLGELVARHRDAYPTRKVSIQPDARNVYVLAVSEFVEEMLANYLGNAEKYSPDRNTSIEIGVRVYDRSVEVVVSDRGVGIRAEDVERLFLPFVRGAATTTQVTGSGIGLAICKRLAELQGGSVWAAPRTGGGSEFGVRLVRATSEGLE